MERMVDTPTFTPHEHQKDISKPAAGGDDWPGGGQVPGHSVWGQAGVVGSAQCGQEDQAGGDDGQHPDTR